MRTDRLAHRVGIGLAAFLAVMVGGMRGTQDAVANGDTRTLTFYHNNTKESLTVTFRRNGQYDQGALQQLNWFLRDWRRAESTRMDPRLFDTVWEVYREAGSDAPVHVNSAYRSPQTNSMLRRRSSAVAKNSQHMQGKALDFYLPDVPASRVRAIGMRLQNGGVGYYPNAYTPFIHLDVGSVRAWPRMTRSQLASIFPDGKTVHVPADGRPLPGYELARAEVLAKGGTVAGYTAYADAEEAIANQPRRKSFWATLFGGGDDEDEDAEEIRVASRPGRALIASRQQPSPQDNYASDSNSSVYAALQSYESPASARRAPVAIQPRPEPPAPAVVASMAPALREDLTPPAPPPLPPTRITGAPSTVQIASGPTLAWQQGPGASEMSIAKGAFAPMPPRRPDVDDTGIEALAGTVALAYAPLPPARPGSLAATNPIPVLADLRGTTDVVSISSAPLPPRRPDLRPVVVASAAPVDIPVTTTGSTPRDPKVKPAAPEAKAVPAPARPQAAAKPPATALSALMSAQPSLHMGFSNKPVGDLATNRFTGPAVKPLKTVQ
ncbi:DUF882 domain-containing protein [Microvirga splendida]|uniref:Murein endopeptidase K n=1 Tax=Microvirga splendida TaxID=2795727 RepID=A0ABS0Y2H4_9HYPH|nr:DUF882 domain-containing protein [Microvirga splendida]MBJ6126501.1 DUF882 domain-containing protein [Microvirga splendida]